MSEGLRLSRHCHEREHGDYNYFSLRPATDGSPQTGDDGLPKHYLFLFYRCLLINLYAVLSGIYNGETLNVLNHGGNLYYVRTDLQFVRFEYQDL